MIQEFNDKNFGDFLENFPLYEKCEFYCNPIHIMNEFQVAQFDTFCKECQTHRTFRNKSSQKSNFGRSLVASQNKGNFQQIKNEINTLIYECLSCRKQDKFFLINLELNTDKVEFKKVGEFPRKELNFDPTLRKFFKNEKEYYSKAEVCLSHGYGIAAFAYFRRIIENNIHQLLEEIASDSEIDANMKTAIDSLKLSSPMSDKIDIAKKALPNHLTASGFNPLGQIYKQLSEGVHSLPDEECLERARLIKGCVSFLVSELAERKRNLEKFKTNIGDLSKFK